MTAPRVDDVCLTDGEPAGRAEVRPHTTHSEFCECFAGRCVEKPAGEGRLDAPEGLDW